MPRNRRPRQREEKREEIVSAARILFLERGYEEVSLARIASAAGVTSTTIYWYFTDKDELLVAVLDVVLAESRQRWTDLAELDLADKLMWVTAELKGMGRLVDTVHNRRLSSRAVDTWHENFHSMADALTRAELPADMPTADAEAHCQIITFVVEGLLTHDHDPATARSIIDTLVQGIVRGQ
ncbi:MAG: TetR/AcrR family transcriptional regulator [Rhodococcus sp. (in: high G+C Gram-positive bacteria)]